ncbi:uncharacterized protein LOC121372967 [Gigantopelta aegis]|uniref:uncharacterized protein LOC121372967 n=1 Tax=Gigantopelta aegis TaxID=1735272 RepID=UPI001B8893E3|nr:uncharacterized protein LOC121372967 [Gigantopelta aegis]
MHDVGLSYECSLTCENGGTANKMCNGCKCTGHWTGPNCEDGGDGRSFGPLLVFIIVCLLFLLLIIITIVLCWRRCRRRPEPVDKTLVPEMIEPPAIGLSNLSFDVSRSKRRASRSSSREGRRPSTSKRGSIDNSKPESLKA